MSDIDPDLPDYLVDAILSQDPPTEAVDLVKNAFTWRTIEAELMELSYDSAGDLAGVRDAAERRLLEFTVEGLVVVIEVEGLRVTGRLTPPGSALLTARLNQVEVEHSIDESGSFVIEVNGPGSLVLTLDVAGRVLSLPVFAVS